MKYWINTITRDHVLLGVEGGYTQANHGKNTGLRRVGKGDWMVFYSPRTTFDGDEACREFTAIGQVLDEATYQVELPSGRMPWRRAMQFTSCQEVPIKPLIGELSFIEDKTHWGYKFRFGLFEIPQSDFELIRHTMQVET